NHCIFLRICVKELQNVLTRTLYKSGCGKRNRISGMRIPENVRLQQLMMISQLRLGIETGPGVIEVDVLTQVQAGINQGMNAIDFLRAAVFREGIGSCLHGVRQDTRTMPSSVVRDARTTIAIVSTAGHFGRPIHDGAQRLDSRALRAAQESHTRSSQWMLAVLR